MKTWQKRKWLDYECCGITGAIEVLTDCDGVDVCDLDQVRCVVHDISGVVEEYCDGWAINWGDEE
jgi:hypothetical protein